MQRFVALRKSDTSSRLPEALEHAPVDVKRNQLLQRSAGSARADRLRKIGLQQFRDGETIPVDENAFQRLGHLGAYIVNAPDQEKSQKAMNELAKDYYIVPNISLSVPKPALRSRKLSLTRRLGRFFWPEESGIEVAHEAGIAGGGVLVGVLDTGCDCDHDEFSGKRIDFRYVSRGLSNEEVRAVRGFDPNGHGTHVCGIIAGQNVGVAPDVELMVASVIESETLKTSLERMTLGLDWILSQISRSENRSKPAIINMSIGIDPGSLSDYERPALDGLGSLIRSLAIDFDVLPVIAVGNSGFGTVCLPGAYDEVIAVGAVDFNRQPAFFSGSGPSYSQKRNKPDLVGYGVNILSSLERDVDNKSWYGNMSGTSMAAPYVTGIAALIASSMPHLQGAQLYDQLISSVKRLENHDEERVGVGLARFAAEFIDP